ncbi:hypothetical protein HC776_03085 [bacterium]|nr:hypothetical protein [bacterium]
MPFTSFGTFSGEFPLPDNILPGHYIITVEGCSPSPDNCRTPYVTSTNFMLGDRRTSNHQVTVRPQSDYVLSGDPLNMDVFATNDNGEARPNALVKWAIMGGTSPFDYKGPELGFSFADKAYQEGFNWIVGEGWTDARGHFLITMPTSHAGRTPLSTLADISVDAVSIRSSGPIVYPASLYVGLRVPDEVAVANQTFPVDVLTVDLTGRSLPNQNVHMIVTKLIWQPPTPETGDYRWDLVEEGVILDQRLVTGENAMAHLPLLFNDVESGHYRIRAEVTDEQGHATSSMADIYVHGSETETSGPDGENLYTHYDDGICALIHPVETKLLRLSPDQTVYAPGETAYIYIPNPYGVPVTALITRERSGVLTSEIVPISDESFIYEMPITEQDVPNVFVSVVLIANQSAALPDPVYIRGLANIKVLPISQRLTLTITPSSDPLMPGEEATFNIRVTDHNGNPVQAEVGLTLIDNAAERYPMQPLEAIFYADQPLAVTTTSSVSALLTTPNNFDNSSCSTDYFGGGIVQAPPSDRLYTPLWEPHIVTDEQGRASVSLTLPDQLTQWHLQAWAITEKTQVGNAEMRLIANKPIHVALVTPKFLAVDDQFWLPAVIMNTTDTPQTLAVTLMAQGLSIEGKAVQTVTVPPRDRVRITWPVLANPAGQAEISVMVVTQTGLRDTSETKTLPILAASYKISVSEALQEFNLIETEAAQKSIQSSDVLDAGFGAGLRWIKDFWNHTLGTLARQRQMKLENVDAHERSKSPLRMEHDYFSPDSLEPIDSAQVGETVLVRVSLWIDEDAYGFVLSDVLPAGLQISSTAGLTDDQAQQGEQEAWAGQSQSFWFWGASFFTHQRLRDEGLWLYADVLPRGHYVLTYETRAILPGIFHISPAAGYALYQPHLFGRSDAAIFTVTSSTQTPQRGKTLEFLC